VIYRWTSCWRATQTAKLPSDIWLWSAVGAIGLAASFQMFGKRQTSLFVGPKTVKTQGSDHLST
jgi:hypothetical protein